MRRSWVIRLTSEYPACWGWRWSTCLRGNLVEDMGIRWTSPCISLGSEVCGSEGWSRCQFHRLQPPPHAHIQVSTAFVLFLNFPICICSDVCAFTCVCIHMFVCSPMCWCVHMWRPEVKLECRSWVVVSLLHETGSLTAWSSPGRLGWSAIGFRDPPVCVLPAQRPQAGVSTSHSTHEYCRINLTPHSL